MYTYRKKATRVKAYSTCVNDTYVGGPFFSGYTSGWIVMNEKGRKIAEATSEKQAKIIVEALNR